MPRGGEVHGVLIDFRPPGGVQHAGHDSDGCGHQLVDDALTVSSAKPEQLAMRLADFRRRMEMLRAQAATSCCGCGRSRGRSRAPWTSKLHLHSTSKVSPSRRANDIRRTPEPLGTSTPKGRRCAWPLLSSCSQPLPLAPPSAAAILRARQGGLLLSNLRSLRVTGLLRTCYSRRGAGAAGP